MLFKKLFKYLLPACSLCLIVYAGWNLYTIHKEYQDGTDLYNEVAEQYVKPVIVDTEEQPEAEEGILDLDVDFESLQAQNPDIVAWIYSPDTLINYPVVQAKDNSYYLRRMLDGRYNKNGTIFMDYRIASDMSDLHTIIYGHNMRNYAMFGTLTEYSKQEYYDEHPFIWLLTPEQNYKIEVISGFITPSDGEVYVFPSSNEERDKLVEYVMKSSDFSSEVDIMPEERLVTLSTCTYEYDDARYVLVGVLRTEEQPEDIIE